MAKSHVRFRRLRSCWSAVCPCALADVLSHSVYWLVDDAAWGGCQRPGSSVRLEEAAWSRVMAIMSPKVVGLVQPRSRA